MSQNHGKKKKKDSYPANLNLQVYRKDCVKQGSYIYNFCTKFSKIQALTAIYQFHSQQVEVIYSFVNSWLCRQKVFLREIMIYRTQIANTESIKINIKYFVCFIFVPFIKLACPFLPPSLSLYTYFSRYKASKALCNAQG